MLDLNSIQQEHASFFANLEREVGAIYSQLVLPNWNGELHGFVQTLHGLMMLLFARIDLLSACWKGSSKDQTLRMIDFMDKYLSPNRHANSMAVQVWRHKLMHTSEPRPLTDERTGNVYWWLLHWHEHLPREQHYTFSEATGMRVLNIGLVYFIQDLKRAVASYIADLSTSDELQANYRKIESEIASYKLRTY